MLLGLTIYIQRSIDKKYRQELIDCGYSVPRECDTCKKLVKELKRLSKKDSILMTSDLHLEIIYHGSDDLRSFISYNGYRTRRSFIL